MDEIHVSDVGTVFRAVLYDGSTVLDISTASSLLIKFKDPAGTVTEKTAVLTGTGTDGKMEYVAVGGFLATAGLWTWQPFVAFASGNQWHGNQATFTVFGNLS